MIRKRLMIDKKFYKILSFRLVLPIEIVRDRRSKRSILPINYRDGKEWE